MDAAGVPVIFISEMSTSGPQSLQLELGQSAFILTGTTPSPATRVKLAKIQRTTGVFTNKVCTIKVCLLYF